MISAIRPASRALIVMGAFVGFVDLVLLGRRMALGALPYVDRVALGGACMAVAMAAMIALASARVVWLGLAPSRRAGTLALALVAGAAGGYLGYLASRGPRAQRLVAPAWFIVAGAVGLTLALVVLQRLLRDRPRVARWSFVVLAIGLWTVDQLVLVGLYAWWHHALVLGVVLCAALAARPLDEKPSPLRPWMAAPIVLCGIAVAHVATTPLLRSIASSSSLLGRMLPLWPVREPPVRADGVALPRLDPVRRMQRHPPLFSARGPARVVLVTIDALRADRLTKETMPHLADLAARGVVFERAYTPTPHTSLAVSSLHTGLDVGSRTAHAALSRHVPTVAELFRDAGWRTAGFFTPAVFTIEPERIAVLAQRDFGFTHVRREHLPASRQLAELEAWLGAEPKLRSFAWLHLFEPHEPYETHPGLTLGSDARGRYDGEVRYTDEELAKLTAWLEEGSIPTLLVVTADHGEEMMEHGGHYHGSSLYEEQVRVPLCFIGFHLELPPHHVTEVVNLVDVAPTLLGASGIDPMKGYGLVLLDWLRGTGEPIGPTFANLGDQRAVIEARRKWIVDRARSTEQLFDLDEDPAEHLNLLGVHPDWRNALAAELLAWEERELGSAADQVLHRAATGEPNALPELVAALPRLAAPDRERAARRLALSAGPVELYAARPLVGEGRPTRWLALGFRRYAATPPTVPDWLADECRTGDVALCAEAGIAWRDVEALGIAVLKLRSDEVLIRRVIAALGAAHDERALDPLLEKLADVRTRPEVVAALDELDDYRVIGPLSRWAPYEPYLTARLAMVRLLRRMEKRDPSGAARQALATLRANETEPEIRAALSLSAATPTPMPGSPADHR